MYPVISFSHAATSSHETESYQLQWHTEAVISSTKCSAAARKAVNSKNWIFLAVRKAVNSPSWIFSSKDSCQLH